VPISTRKHLPHPRSVLGKERPLAAQELDDRLELRGVEVAESLVAVGHQRTVDRRAPFGELRRDLDDDPPAIGCVALPPHEAGSLEVVEHASHRPSSEVGGFGQLPRRHRTSRPEDVETAPVSGVEAGHLRDRRIEELLVGLPAADLGTEGRQGTFALP